MDGRNGIANDLFYKVRSRFTGLKLGTENGEITINPEDARFFDFDYNDAGTAVGHVTVSLAEPNSMKVYFSSGITEDMNTPEKNRWYGFLKELREFAKRRLMSFDTRDITKDNLDRRDFQFLSTISKPKQDNNKITKSVGESTMNESTLYGSRTMSYQKLMDTRLIIKHSKALVDDQQAGARSRNISSLFVENQDGERFKYPFIHLAGARAMQRHVANQGLPYDDIGKSIIGMSEQIAQLKSFSNYVVRNDLMNSDTNNIVETSAEALRNLREQMSKLSKQTYYESYKENFQVHNPVEVPNSVVEEFKDKFTVKSFREEIESVFPILYRLMQNQNTVDYNDIVEESTIENDEADVDLNEDHDELAEFENWIMNLGEGSPIQSSEEQLLAIENLKKLTAETFPAGVDGTNAIESLKGIIEDPNLFKSIKDLARQNPQEDVRPLLKAWMEENAKEIASEIEFGDMDTAEVPAEVPAEEPTDTAAGEEPAEQPVTQGDDNQNRGSTEKFTVEKLAEFITSFYDRDSGTFPKGPEGVCTMVGKKFGEQAETVARKFVERMAPQQSTEQNPELAELSRVRELAGLQTEDDYVDELSRSTVKSYAQKKRDLLKNRDDDYYDTDKKDEIGRDIKGIKGAQDRLKGNKSTSEDAELESIRKLSGMQGNETYDPTMDPEYRSPQRRKIDPDDRDQEPVGYGSGPTLQRSPEEEEEFEKMMRYIERGGYNNKKNSKSSDNKLKDNVQAENAELESIKKLSGISQGMGF